MLAQVCRAVFVPGVLVALLLSGRSVAMPGVDGPGTEFFVSTRGMKVSAILQDIGTNYRVPMIVSNNIKDTFVGRLEGASAIALLDQLAQLSGLAWYHDGNAFYVYKSDEVRTEVLTLSWLGTSDLLESLASANALRMPYCTARPLANVNAVEVYGVPVCVERATKLATQLDRKRETEEQREEGVRVFPLRYASAIDTTYTYRDEQVTVPGLVTELRAMSGARSLPFVRAATVSGEADSDAGNDSSRPVATAAPVSAFPPPAANNLPVFSADARNNAVIVRDRRANLPLYEDLIAQLDRRPVQIEISVAIIDVDAANMSNLGVEFGGSMRFGPAKVEFNPAASGEGTGVISTVLSSTGDFFMRINALEQTSNAKVLSRPSIVTLNNVQAVLDHNVTFYTKLEAEKAVKLESISAGSLMRVTPRIVEDNGVQDVMLTLDLQDGQQSAAFNEKENLPQVKNSSISTQAVLKPGQSLLLGGFVQDKARAGKNKTPWLGDLPLVGRLFRSDSHESRSVVRLFLIKAQPVEPDRGS